MSALRRSAPVVLLLLFAGNARGVHTAVDADAGERFDVAIRLRVDRSIEARRVTPFMKREVEAIWEPYGVRLEWTDADGAETPVKTVSLDVTVERELEERYRIRSPVVLGHTDVTPEAPAWRPIRVSFDATEEVLAERAFTRAAIGGMVLERDVGLALGRVLAHEIGHVLLGPPFHDRAGLMRAAFRPTELAEPDRRPFRLTCNGATRLRNRLRALSGDPLRERRGAPCIHIQ
jgi:hypothetical protein